MIWTLWWLRVRRDRNVGGYWHVAYAVVAVMTVVVITLTGHIGGILSGVVTG
jgi:hypothetical protein